MGMYFPLLSSGASCYVALEMGIAQPTPAGTQRLFIAPSVNRAGYVHSAVTPASTGV